MKTALALTICSLLSFPVAASDAYGDAFEGWGFVSDDWQLVCDNTLTCRAAGYAQDGISSDELQAASILITAQAGERFPKGEVQLNNWGDVAQEKFVNNQLVATDYKVELWLNDQFHGTVKLSTDREGQLSREQTQQLLKRAHQNTEIQFRSGDLRWQVSDIGMAAILLKLDDIQGRVGSPLALVSKQSANRQRLKSAKAIPKIYAVETYPITEYGDDDPAKMSDEQKFYHQLSERYDRQWQSKMSAWVIPTLNAEDRDTCNVLTSDNDWFDKKNKVWQFTPIDSKYTLASHPCWTGAYNFGSGYWLINNDKPNTPELITLSGSEYADGEIFAAHKDRGIGDCWSIKNWTWDGKTFSKTFEQTTGMCRGIQAGGAWGLPTYISEVIKK